MSMNSKSSRTSMPLKREQADPSAANASEEDSHETRVDKAAVSVDASSSVASAPSHGDQFVSAERKNNQNLDGTNVDEAISSPAKKISQYATVASLISTLFIAAMDETILGTAIPTIAEQLHSGTGFAWIAGSYLLGTAASGPVVVKISDIWGRKPIMLFCVALFFISSLVSALAVDMTMLICGRAIQGIAGGGFLNLVAVVLSDLYSERERALYFTFMGLGWSFSAAVGPLLGGALSQKASWRWCFWINLPVTGLAFLLLLMCLRVHNPKTKLRDGLRAFDWSGTVCLVGFTILILLGLQFGGQVYPWTSTQVVCLIAFGGLLVILFVIAETKLAKYPILPPRLFGNISTVASLVVAFIHSFVSLGIICYFPLYLQSVRDMSPLRSGIMTLSFAVTDGVITAGTGWVLHRVGSFIELLWVGTILLTLGSGLLLMLNVNSSVGVLVVLQILVGFGIGILFQPALQAVQARTAQDDIASAIGAFGLSRAIASAVGVVVGGVVFSNSMSEQKWRLEAAGAPLSLISQYTGTEAAAHAHAIKSLADPAVKMAVKEAYASSFRNVWILYTTVAAVSVIAAGLVRRKILRTEHTETRTGLEKGS